MAKFTREQLNKWNLQAGNGFKIDVQKLLFWGGKELEYIGEERADRTHFEITLSYVDEKEGEGWMAKSTGRQLLKLDVKRMIPAISNKPDDEVKMYNVDFGVYSEIIGEPQNKKMFSYMAKMSHKIDVAFVLAKAEAARPIEEKPEAAPVILGETAEEPAPEIKDNDPIYEGASFSTASGEVITITRLSDMSVDFSNSSNLYDFGTSRTVGAIIDALESSNGKGVKCFYNPAPETEEPAQEEPTAETIETKQEEAEAAPEEDTAEAESEPAQKAAPDMVTALKNDGIDPESAFDVAVMSGGWDALKPETSPEADASKEEPAETETKPETGKNSPAAPAFDTFAALAQAYISGTQAPKQPETAPKTVQTEEPTPEAEKEPEEDEDAPQGYFNNNNDTLTDEARKALANGGQAQSENRCGNTTTLFTLSRSEGVRYVYSILTYKDEQFIQPRKPDYLGFLINDNYYCDNDPIIEKYQKDVNKKLVELIPDEESAGHAAANIDDIDFYKEHDFTDTAQKLFYKGEKPKLWLFGLERGYITQDVIINYLLNPAEEIERAALAYMCAKPDYIYKAYIKYNKISAIYNTIVSDPTREEHGLLKVSRSITDEKTVRIELANGKEVRAEARAVKAITRNGHIDSWYILAADRELLSKNEYNRPADIQLKDIKAIKHGGRVLYKAA